MKPTLLILGVIFGGIGVFIIFGTLVTFIEGTSEYSLTSDLLGLVFMGILPLSIGIFFLYKSLYKK